MFVIKDTNEPISLSHSLFLPWQQAAGTTSLSGKVHQGMINTLRLRQNGRRFTDDTFKRLFLNEKVRISIKISSKLVPKGPINNNPALVQIMAWRWSGDRPLSEPMIVSLLTHICVTQPQWVNCFQPSNVFPYSVMLGRHHFKAQMICTPWGVNHLLWVESLNLVEYQVDIILEQYHTLETLYLFYQHLKRNTLLTLHTFTNT